MGVGDNVRDDLLLVDVGVNAADDGNIHLEVVRGEQKQVVAVAVPAAVIIQRKDRGSAQLTALDGKHLRHRFFFLGNLDDHFFQHRGKLTAKIRKISICQRNVCNGVDEQLRVGGRACRTRQGARTSACP